MVSQQHIIIVGAGIVGLSTAYALLKRGTRRVIVVEQEKVDHQRASSHGFSRLLRFEYGPDPFYAEMVRLSLERWRHLERLAGRRLYTPTGVLVLGAEDDHFTRSSYHVTREMGLPVERLTEQECRQRFPQFDTQAYAIFTYNAEGGILHASTCLQALRDLIIALGGEIRESCRVTSISSESQSRSVRLHLSSGAPMEADHVVLAAGPWVHKLLADMHLPVRLTRQHLLYFAGLPTPAFEAGVFPAFLAHDLYGFPIHKGCNGWVKAASHAFGTPIEVDDRTPPGQEIITGIITRLRELLPALHHARLARIDSCMYDVTPDEDFILDHLPNAPRVIFATGLSGHAFKFGLLLGELLSSMVLDAEPAVAMERFRLARFTSQARRQGSRIA